MAPLDTLQNGKTYHGAAARSTAKRSCKCDFCADLQSLRELVGSCGLGIAGGLNA